jgi:hypothetical protein
VKHLNALRHDGRRASLMPEKSVERIDGSSDSGELNKDEE